MVSPEPVRPEVAELDAHPAVAALSPVGRGLVRSGGQQVVVPAGEVATQRWAADRDFYLVLAGRLGVDVGGETVRTLGPGEFFGELAARDWGSGFGYPRLATVTAQETAQLWRLPPEVFGELVGTEPAFAALVAEASRERLARS
jgi:CRP-like cAMP-binding protein